MATFERRVTKEGQPRWTMRVYVGRDENGRARFVIRTFGTKKEAQREARRVEGMKDRGVMTAPSKETVAKYLRRWLADVMKGRLRARTWADYSGVLRRYVEQPPDGAPPVGCVRMDRLSPEGIQALYGWLLNERGLSPRTIRSLHAVVRQGLQYATKTGSLGRNPADLVDLPKQERRRVDAMTSEEAAAFLEAAREDRYHALWCVLLSGGLRPGEALGLRWEDLDLDAAKIHIQRALTRRGVPKVCECGHARAAHESRGAGSCGECPSCQRFAGRQGWKLVEPKTSRGRRVVVLPEFAVKALREWRAAQARERLQLGAEYGDHGFVFTNEFGRPLEGANLYDRNFRRVMEAAELGEWGPERPKAPRGPKGRRRFEPKYRLYDLRHSAATFLLRAGVNPKVVSERLGHASVAFTMDVYAASLPDLQEEAAEKIEAAFGTGS